MSERERNLHREIQRILVALDASSSSQVALQTAVNLAVALEAELEGIFVEDINLLRLAELPFVHEVRTLSAVAQQMSRQQIEAELQAQAARARRALMAAALEARVPATFRVLRGRVPLELIAAATEADLLMLGRISRPLTRRVHVGSTARIVATRAPRSVLLVQSTPVQRIMVTYDGSPLGRRALTTAAQLSLAQPAPRIGETGESPGLTVLLVAEEREQAQQLQTEAARWLASWNITADFYWLGQATVANLARAIEEAACHLLVLGGERVPLSEDTVQSLLDRVNCSLLVVRERE